MIDNCPSDTLNPLKSSFECWNILSFWSTLEVTNILVTRDNVLYLKRICLQKNERFIFKDNVKVFPYNPLTYFSPLRTYSFRAPTSGSLWSILDIWQTMMAKDQSGNIYATSPCCCCCCFSLLVSFASFSTFFCILLKIINGATASGLSLCWMF